MALNPNYGGYNWQYNAPSMVSGVNDTPNAYAPQQMQDYSWANKLGYTGNTWNTGGYGEQAGTSPTGVDPQFQDWLKQNNYSWGYGADPKGYQMGYFDANGNPVSQLEGNKNAWASDNTTGLAMMAAIGGFGGAMASGALGGAGTLGGGATAGAAAGSVEPALAASSVTGTTGLGEAVGANLGATLGGSTIPTLTGGQLLAGASAAGGLANSVGGGPETAPINNPSAYTPTGQYTPPAGLGGDTTAPNVNNPAMDTGATIPPLSGTAAPNNPSAYTPGGQVPDATTVPSGTPSTAPGSMPPGLGSTIGNLLGGGTAGNLVGGAVNSALSPQGLSTLLSMMNDRNQANTWQQQMNQLNDNFSTNSPYAQQMAQTLAAKDAAAGRNSQYGPRAAQLAGGLAEAKSKAMGNLIQMQSNANNSTTSQYRDLLSLLGSSNGSGGSSSFLGQLGSGVSSGFNDLLNMLGGG